MLGFGASLEAAAGEHIAGSSSTVPGRPDSESSSRRAVAVATCIAVAGFLAGIARGYGATPCEPNGLGLRVEWSERRGPLLSLALRLEYHASSELRVRSVQSSCECLTVSPTSAGCDTVLVSGSRVQLSATLDVRKMSSSIVPGVYVYSADPQPRFIPLPAEALP